MIHALEILAIPFLVLGLFAAWLLLIGLVGRQAKPHALGPGDTSFNQAIGSESIANRPAAHNAHYVKFVVDATKQW